MPEWAGMSTLKIKVIVGSTRANRFGEKPAQWIFDLARQRADLDVELLDLRDYPLPFFEEAMPPGLAKDGYTNPAVVKWRDKIREGDGFIICTPEYNHGYPAVLKNALDYAYVAWNKKPVAFVSYGGAAGGVRAVQQLRQVAIELQMAPVRDEVNIPLAFKAFNDKGEPNDDRLASRAATMFRQLVWWARVLHDGRANTAYNADA